VSVPSNDNLLVRPRSIHPPHQLGHRLVIIHIHRNLTLRLGMRQRKTRPDLELCDSARCGADGRIGMSDAEKGSDDAGLWGLGLGGGTTGVVVEDLGEDGGVDCYSCRGSTAEGQVKRSAGHR
jgi:hypothetical protein